MLRTGRIAVALCLVACGDADKGTAISARDAGTEASVQVDASADGAGREASGGREARDASSSMAGASGTGGAKGVPPDAGPSDAGATVEVSCTNSLDCVDAPGGRSICEPDYNICVECVTSADCPENHDCTAEECIAFTPCKNSLNCSLEQVCDTTTEHCVDCVTTADCEEGEICVLSSCRLACASDRQCTPFGLLCNPDEGYCAECYRHEDCPNSEYCDRGTCRADRCEQSRSECRDGAVVTCSESGSGIENTTPCAGRQTCVDEDGTASCMPWVCTAGETECSSISELVTCSDDGLSVIESTDCTETDQSCVQAACSDLECPPSEAFCQGNEVRQCDTEGLSSSVVTTCGTDQYCDNASATCKAQICTPDEPGCNDNSVATCNEDGSGFVSEGTSCGDQICVDAECTDLTCTPNSSFCSGMEVRQCAADGMSSTVTTTCTAAQYCDTTSASCKTQVCTPNAVGCDGNSIATCNGTGSGFLSDGTPCGTKRCAGGACVSALLTDDFEDGDYDGWTLGTTIPVLSSASAEVVTSTAADGSAHSLAVTGSSSFFGLFSDYASHSVAATPLSASFWGRVATTASSCTFSLGTSVAVGFSSAGTFTGTGASPASYSTDRWYHFEIRDVDWTAGTYSVYVDGELQGSSIAFTPPTSGEATSVRLNVTPPTTGDTVCLWDEIVVK